ncbi:DUF362 domain-containing protein [Desulfobacterales bacterium HSG2]|nr:DUF362 domain-containing protein [Desulfobacterales bacterium HSG2]MDM8548552.1 DUF362 domain-containing protein [Desulfobacterales bacterium HSG2]
MNRREFLIRAGKAGASVAAACSVCGYFYDPAGPGPSSDKEATVSLPDFSVSGQARRMCVVRGENRTRAIQRAFDALGGIETFVKKGDRVLLKVNAAFASPAMLSATTHPDIVAETARLCFKAGASEVVVTDNPINDPASCFMLTGIGEAARSVGAEVLLPADDFFKPATVPGAELIIRWPLLYTPFEKTDKLIGISPVKDHHRSGASMSMKNWYGLLGGRRNIFHQDIHNIIKELAMMVRPSLVILDGMTTMMTNGPTGGSLSDLKQTDTMIVSTDQVAADAFAATLLGKTVRELPHIAKAEAAGAGVADYRLLNPVMI